MAIVLADLPVDFDPSCFLCRDIKCIQSKHVQVALDFIFLSAWNTMLSYVELC